MHKFIEIFEQLGVTKVEITILALVKNYHAMFVQLVSKKKKLKLKNKSTDINKFLKWG